jgi:hypothetical protein
VEAVLETRLSAVSDIKTQASVHLSLNGWSFTVSGILLHKEDDRWRLTMPLSSFGSNRRPPVTMQGALKEAVYSTLSADHQVMRESGQRVFHNEHAFSEDLATELNCAPD